MLRDPPVTGLALGRSLGCLVAARLAARHGITVRLRAGEGEGVAAYVILPAAPPGGGAGRAAPIADAPSLTAAADARPRCRDADGPSASSDALPARPTSTPASRPSSTEDEPADGAAARARVGAEVPPTRRRAASVAHAAAFPGATTEALPEPLVEPPVRRSPDEVRALLSRYRSGLEAGRAPTRSRSREERS